MVAAIATRTKQLVDIDGGKVVLNLHAGQSRVWDSERRFVFMVAGTQSGKTSFGPWWLYREIQRCGSGDYIAATSTFDLFKLKMLPEIQNVYEHILGVGRYWAGDMVMEIADPETGQFLAKRSIDPMYARIILRSATAKGGLESATALAAWLDEAGQDEFPVTAWEAVQRRLSLSRGRVLGTTTLYNLGWLKQQIYDPFERGDPSIDVISFDSITNPAFPEEEFEEQREKMPEWKFNMFYRGIFSRPAGMIYKDFIDAYKDEGGHKVPAFIPPPQWPRWVGVDPGAVNLAKLWLAYDAAEDVYYLHREKHGGEMSTAEHYKEARDASNEHNERIVAWYVGNKSEKQQRLDWKAAGAKAVKEPPITDVESGIDKVIALFRQHRLYITDDCTGTLDQLGTYRRKLDENGEATDAIKDKEKYHFLDALRYVVAGAVAPPRKLKTTDALEVLDDYRG